MKLDHSAEMQTPPPVNSSEVELPEDLEAASNLIDYSKVSDPFGYIYLTTNNVNGKVYVGKSEYADFNPYYFGSGARLKRVISKYGIDRFSVVILIHASTLKELNGLEKKLIARYREALGRDNVYNIADGGDGGCLRLGMKGNFREGTHHTEEAKRKISVGNKGTVHSPESIAQQKESHKWFYWTDDQRQKLSQSAKISWAPKRREAAKGKIPWNKGTGTSHLRSTAPKTGKHQTDLQIEKRNAWRYLLPSDQSPILPDVIQPPKVKQIKPPVTEETRQKLRDLAAKNLTHNILTHTSSNNVRFGKKHTAETIAKMKAKAQSRPTLSDEAKGRIRDTLIVRNVVCRVIKKLDKYGTLAVI